MLSKKAFTLIELLIVILIVAILASIAVPILRSAKKNAIVTEAVTALGTIRTAERLYYLEYGEYLHTQNIGPIYAIPGIEEGALTGTYFSEDCYEVCVGGDGFELELLCWPDNSTAVKKQEVKGWPYTSSGYIVMDQNGNIYSDFEGLGYNPIP